MQITIEIDDHLAKAFMDFMSCSGEQQLEDWMFESKLSQDSYITCDYPGYKEKIVIKEVNL